MASVWWLPLFIAFLSAGSAKRSLNVDTQTGSSKSLDKDPEFENAAPGQMSMGKVADKSESQQSDKGEKKSGQQALFEAGSSQTMAVETGDVNSEVVYKDGNTFIEKLHMRTKKSQGEGESLLDGQSSTEQEEVVYLITQTQVLPNPDLFNYSQHSPVPNSENEQDHSLKEDKGHVVGGSTIPEPKGIAQSPSKQAEPVGVERAETLQSTDVLPESPAPTLASQVASSMSQMWSSFIPQFFKGAREILKKSWDIPMKFAQSFQSGIDAAGLATKCAVGADETCIKAILDYMEEKVEKMLTAYFEELEHADPREDEHATNFIHRLRLILDFLDNDKEKDCEQIHSMWQARAGNIALLGSNKFMGRFDPGQELELLHEAGGTCDPIKLEAFTLDVEHFQTTQQLVPKWHEYLHLLVRSFEKEIPDSTEYEQAKFLAEKLLTNSQVLLDNGKPSPAIQGLAQELMDLHCDWHHVEPTCLALKMFSIPDGFKGLAKDIRAMEDDFMDGKPLQASQRFSDFRNEVHQAVSDYRGANMLNILAAEKSPTQPTDEVGLQEKYAAFKSALATEIEQDDTGTLLKLLTAESGFKLDSSGAQVKWPEKVADVFSSDVMSEKDGSLKQKQRVDVFLERLQTRLSKMTYSKGDNKDVKVTKKMLTAKAGAFFNEVNKVHESHKRLQKLVEEEVPEAYDKLYFWRNMTDGTGSLYDKIGNRGTRIAKTPDLAGFAVNWEAKDLKGKEQVGQWTIKWEDGEKQLKELKDTKRDQIVPTKNRIEARVKVLAKQALYLIGTALQEEHTWNSIKSLVGEFVQWGVKVTRIQYVSYWTSSRFKGRDMDPHDMVPEHGSSLSEGYSSKRTAQIMKDFAVKVGNKQRWQVDSKSHIMESMMESEHSLTALYGDDCGACCECCGECCGSICSCLGSMFSGGFSALEWLVLCHCLADSNSGSTTGCCDCLCSSSSTTDYSHKRRRDD